jgi:hypothetical protein
VDEVKEARETGEEEKEEQVAAAAHSPKPY